jgi:hypothetical protein
MIYYDMVINYWGVKLFKFVGCDNFILFLVFNTFSFIFLLMKICFIFIKKNYFNGKIWPLG